MNTVRLKVSAFFDRRYDAYAQIYFYIFILLGSLYVFYPNYLDHIESTIAVLGGVMQRGEALYPAPDPYPYHGILYGPALAEIQGLFHWIGLPVMVGSKLPGILAFILASNILLRLNRKAITRGYLLFLFPYIYYLFWDRAEPFFLLIISLSLFLAEKLPGSKLLPVLLGILAGAASALKLHGIAYVLAAYLAIVLTGGASIGAVVVFALLSCISFITFFLPQNISFFSFINYLKIAGHHGLSMDTWQTNIMYWFALLVPLLVVWRNAKTAMRTNVYLTIILGIEFFITILGAKPGAGLHHLFPFIPLNAYLMAYLLPEGEKLRQEYLVRVVYVVLTIISLITAVKLASLMMRHWHQYAAAGREVISCEAKYTGLVMGIGEGDQGYEYTYLRVLLNRRQIDFPAFMDLQFSGVGDGLFVENLSNGSIKHILVPNEGTPFAMLNFYTGKPLFSGNVQKAFTTHYRCIKRGEAYSVYAWQISNAL
ncbi:MAG: hypothetical protein WCG19_00840 [Chlorobiaceae bacterium]